MKIVNCKLKISRSHALRGNDLGTLASIRSSNVLRSAFPPTRSVDRTFPRRAWERGRCFNYHFAIPPSVRLWPPPPPPRWSTPSTGEPKIVKIYGAGGFRGMESYQSGMLVSPEGHILTAFSYVLDTDYIDAALADGRKFEAKLIGADPRLEVAVLKIEAAGLPCSIWANAARAEAGTRVLALSNCLTWPSATSRLACRRGRFRS